MGLRTWLGIKKPKRGKAEGASQVAPRISRVNPANGYRLIDEGGIERTFPIDVVYTWVDLEDPDFRELLARHLPPDAAANRNTMARTRFQCHEELRYSLRSLQCFAPWVNRIFIVTNGQVPRWLAPHPKITLVRHEEILEPEYLPTFNSHVIGSALHRIPGLGEHYIYFNDDVMLLRPIEPSDAFTANGLAFGFVGNITLPDGPPLPHETATHWGAKNARDLVRRQWGRGLDRRFAHMFHPQLKSVAEECESLFAAEYRSFRQNKFRQPNDVLCCSYLHPVAAYLTGRGIFARGTWWYLKIRHASARQLYENILAEQDTQNARMAACFNDYLPADNYLPDYESYLQAFLEAYFPLASTFELDRSGDVDLSAVSATGAGAEPLVHSSR